MSPTPPQSARPRAATPVIVLGGGAQHRRFVAEIRRRGHPLTLVDRDPGAPCRTLADRFVQASIHDGDACRKALAPIAEDGARLITFATGAAGRTCVDLCRTFGLPARSRTLAEATFDKRSLRCTLRRAGLPVVEQRTLDVDDLDAALAGIRFPAILKPARGGGGRHVERVETRDEVRARVERDRAHGPFVLQPWLEGVERALCLWVQHGRPVALLHGENILEPACDWPWPIGQVLERCPTTGPRPAWLEIVPRLIEAFELVDDFVVLELISTETGHHVIDVEMNALGPFACSEVMDGGVLVRALVDLYLGEPVCALPEAPWVAGLAFVASSDEAAVAALRGRRIDTDAYRFDGSESWARLECGQRQVFKGGYVVTRCARTASEARATALEIAERMREGG